MYYFGCWKDSGHYLYDSEGLLLGGRQPVDVPVKIDILDGGFLPPNQPEEQGLATLVYINGWTILAFWDRSGDTRGQSNSCFLVRGMRTFDQMVADSKKMFPEIWARFNFDVRERSCLNMT